MHITHERLGQLILDHASYLTDEVWAYEDRPAEVILTVQALYNLGEALTEGLMEVRS